MLILLSLTFNSISKHSLIEDLQKGLMETLDKDLEVHVQRPTNFYIRYVVATYIKI